MAAKVRKQKMLETVREMFALRERTPEGDELDAEGVPLRVRRLSERIYAPNVRFNVPGRGPQAFSGGLQAYHDYHAVRVKKTDDKLDLKLLDILLGEDHAAALIRYHDEHDGKVYEWLRVNVFEFDEAGERIVNIRTYEHDQYLVDECFSKGYGT